MVTTLSESLSTLVEAYNQTFKPLDYQEWKVVLSEISTFSSAEKRLDILDENDQVLDTCTRIKRAPSAKIDKDGIAKMKLQEAILVGNYQNQIKFAELTLDMYVVV
jgi:Protein SCAI